MSKIKVDHFSDVLCIWAYVSQIRVEELLTEFGDKVEVDYHFFPVFGDVPGKMEKSWGDRGGIETYNAHVQSVADKFDHLDIHPDVWVKNTPQSSLPAHLFLAAAKMAELSGLAREGPLPNLCKKCEEHSLLRREIFPTAWSCWPLPNSRVYLSMLSVPVSIVERPMPAFAVICINRWSWELNLALRLSSMRGGKNFRAM